MPCWPPPPVVLAIAAHDPLGGAGLAADLTTFAAFGVHGTVAVTAVTAQHLRSVDRVEPMDSGLVADQIDAIADTFSLPGSRPVCSDRPRCRGRR